MTQVTSLERAVIRNIAVSTTAAVLVKSISSGPETIKDTQVNAVILNLKKKGLVAVSDAQTVTLTVEGESVHNREFPSVKDLDTLRHESNVELAQVQPMSVEELKLTNQLIEVRKSANKIGKALFALQVALISDQLLKEALQEQQLAA